MEDNKWESTHVHTQWGTTNRNQPISTKLIYWECAAIKMVSKGWNKAYKTHWYWAHMITKGCSHNMVGNKWESIHIYQAHLIKKRCENSKQLVESHPISTRLMLPEQQTWCHQTTNNKWASTHIYQAHTTSNNSSRQQIRINPCLLHLSRLGFAVIDNKWASTYV